MAKRKPSPALQAELPRDRCPNCGGPLKFPEHQKEGICAACGIFVEIVLSTPDSGAPKEGEVPDVATRRETAKFYLASEELLTDEAGAESPAEAGEAGGPRTAEPEAAASAPKPEEPAVGSALPAGVPEHREPEASSAQSKSVEETLPIREPQAPPEIAPELGPTSEPARSSPESTIEASPEPEPPARETLTQEQGDQEIAEPGLAIAEAETVVEPESEVVEETEVFGEPDAEAELIFEEPASTYAVEEQEAMVPAPIAVAPAAQARAAASGKTRFQPRLRDRVLLYIGSMLVAFGGSGLILGSILHDLLRVPQFGYAYEVFGPVNLSAMLFGGIFLVAGLVAIGVSLRGGVVNLRKAARA